MADELNSDNIKDRDSKMAFLQKLIDVVSKYLSAPPEPTPPNVAWSGAFERATWPRGEGKWDSKMLFIWHQSTRHGLLLETLLGAA